MHPSLARAQWIWCCSGSLSYSIYTEPCWRYASFVSTSDMTAAQMANKLPCYTASAGENVLVTIALHPEGGLMLASHIGV